MGWGLGLLGSEGGAALGNRHEVRARKHICAAGFLFVALGKVEGGASKQDEGLGGREDEERKTQTTTKWERPKNKKRTTSKQLTFIEEPPPRPHHHHTPRLCSSFDLQGSLLFCCHLITIFEKMYHSLLKWGVGRAILTLEQSAKRGRWRRGEEKQRGSNR